MNIYESISKFFVENPTKIFLLFIFTTIGLILSYLFIPYRGDASTSPNDPIIDLDKKISLEFSDEAHFAFFILESKNGDDILSKDNLLNIYLAENKLRKEDINKKLSPETISPKEHLFSYIDSETGTSVNGLLTIADIVNEILNNNPNFNKSLSEASNEEVKEVLSVILGNDDFTEVGRNISVHSSISKRNINGKEIDWWTSPAITIAVLADNESLGGGSQRVALSGDKATIDKEKFNTKVLELLKKELPQLNVWGVAIDVNLEGERQGFSSALFITLTVIAAIAVVGFSLRSYWAVVLIGIGLSILMIWLKGFSYLLGLKGGLVADMIVPIAMISLGVDFGVHAIRRYQEEKNNDISFDRKFIIAFTGVGAALTLAFISDAIAFLSNITAGIESIVHFGLAAGVATFAAYIVLGIYAPFLLSRIESLDNKSNIFSNKLFRLFLSLGSAGTAGGSVIVFLLLSPILGVLLAVINILFFLITPIYFVRGERPKNKNPQLRISFFEKFESYFSSIILFFSGKPIITVLFFSLITIYTTFLAFKLEASFEVADFFNPQSDFVKGLDKLDYHLGDTTGEIGLIYIKGSLDKPEAISDIKKLVNNLDKKDFLAHDTKGNLLLIEPNILSLLEFGGIDTTDQSKIKEYFNQLIDNGLLTDSLETIFSPNRIKFALIKSENDFSTVLRVGIPDSASQGVTTLARNEIEKELDILKDKDYFSEFGITGSPFVRDVELSSGTNALFRSIPLAALASFIVLFITFRSIKYAFITTLPIGLVVSWLYGIMYIGGYSLNFVTATIGAISIGVGIDFSIHITQRFREEIRKNSKEVALRKTLNGTGIALLGSALSSMAGFAIMGMAPMPLFASFGQITAIMILLALISSVFVLPSLLVLVSRKK
ncbi:MAG: MMPL family transporter [Dehalococcoidia bacterium]|nr:MMPL family transporter [Dehalococcoidia bacterium]